MNEEEAFQAALDANPSDHVTRLVFADWLDEQGDPRGPGYRALGQARLYPQHSPDYTPWNYNGEDWRERRSAGAWSWWRTADGSKEGHPLARSVLDNEWFEGLKTPYNYIWGVGVEQSKDYFTRREADDDAALA